MFDIHRVELDWGGRKLVLETGKMARQDEGAVVATYGEAKVLGTLGAADRPRHAPPGSRGGPSPFCRSLSIIRRNPMPRAEPPAVLSSPKPALPRRRRLF